ncbi:DUF1028 domain-containing protein [Aliicoccus persicus]|uniref:Uncharacterized conserved protein, Ntn-hydrolase superfamily n=1 Tax=Aliicoccus persicus TaxID=930138 RepID=A0A662Z9D7_9STAP|nr:DUF1028 domain-containing protein [Aliicoccus persicus]SEW19725.1 Uncharacterized conserved protein, Ntn-hydrolase superfamily [Aliicoccus persicus]
MTFSISARCEKTNQLGVAISTAVLAVGARFAYAKAHVGAIASQSISNPYIAIRGLELLQNNLNASEVLAVVISRDPDRELRQVGIIDKNGQSAAFSGESCEGYCGHLTGHNYAIQGNTLVGEETLTAMEVAFITHKELSLAERLLKTIEAGQEAGGDNRGRQSAALLVVDNEEYPVVDLRVDEHDEPVKELRRIYEIANRELYPILKRMPKLLDEK